MLIRALALIFIVGVFHAPAQESSPAPGAAFTAEGESKTPATTESVVPVETTTASPQEPWALAVEPDPQVKIKKVYEFLNDKEKTPVGKSKSLAYEFKYFDHGAITKAQQESRKGQYFVITWSNGGSPEDLVLRLDYRQAVTRDKVNTLEIPFKQAKGTFKGTFSVTGPQYAEFGDVHSWRISVVRAGRIVAQEQSFVW
jgi:hypothetical protein